MKFIITVDTEADNQWKKDEKVILRNIKNLPRFQNLCEKYNFKPTYLVTYEVADDVDSSILLKKWVADGKVEVGAHLHPWTTPPFFSYENGKHMFPSDLPDADFQSKLELLTFKIKDTICMPTSYRAGRWGFKESHATYLIDNGYIVDSSVTPKISWNSVAPDTLGGMHGPDFKSESLYPHYISSGLLEIPMTIVYTGLLNSESSFFVKKFTLLGESFIKKVLHKLFFKKKWLRIFPETQESDWNSIYKSAEKNTVPVLQFMIHSSELTAGCSPYVKSDRDLEKVYRNLESLFAYLQHKGVESVTLSQFATTYRK